MNGKTLYYVEAHTKSGDSLAEDIWADNLWQLATFVRESFAHMNGCHDTSEVDCSWIKFEYDFVEGDEGEDLTAEANRIANL